MRRGEDPDRGRGRIFFGFTVERNTSERNRTEEKGLCGRGVLEQGLAWAASLKEGEGGPKGRDDDAGGKGRVIRVLVKVPKAGEEKEGGGKRRPFVQLKKLIGKAGEGMRGRSGNLFA